MSHIRNIYEGPKHDKTIENTTIIEETTIEKAKSLLLQKSEAVEKELYQTLDQLIKQKEQDLDKIQDVVDTINYVIRIDTSYDKMKQAA